MTGVRLINSSNIIIISNNFTHNNVTITLDRSYNNTIIENNVIDNYGYESNHRVTCNAIILVGCCSYNTITRNNISKNTGGIFISSFDTVSDAASCCNKITKNYIVSNKNYGIYLDGVINATVVCNVIANNGYGIIGSMSHSTFYHNNFINNTVQVRSRTPVGKPNLWDNGIEGNYWSDYNGTDTDGDGIGDTPYIIERKWVWIEPTTNTPVTYGVDTEDRYPLMRPVAIQLFPSEESQTDGSAGQTSLSPTAFLIAVPIVLTITLSLAFYRRKRKD